MKIEIENNPTYIPVCVKTTTKPCSRNVSQTPESISSVQAVIHRDDCLMCNQQSNLTENKHPAIWRTCDFG